MPQKKFFGGGIRARRSDRPAAFRESAKNPFAPANPRVAQRHAIETRDARKTMISRFIAFIEFPKLTITRSVMLRHSARSSAARRRFPGTHLRPDTMLGIISPRGAEPLAPRVTGSVTMVCTLGCRLIKPRVLRALPPTRARRRNTSHVHAPTRVRVNAFICVNIPVLRRELSHTAQTRRPIRLSQSRFSMWRHNGERKNGGGFTVAEQPWLLYSM